MKKSILFLAILILLYSCENKDETLQVNMIGGWETTLLKIEYKTYNGEISDFVYEDKFQNNPPRRAQSKYYPDGTFEAWFVDPNNERIGEKTNGTWKTSKDSLFTSYFYLGKQIDAKYVVKDMDAYKSFKAFSLFDWDDDGYADDLLTMEAKRINL